MNMLGSDPPNFPDTFLCEIACTMRNDRTANLPTNVMDFRGFDSSRILNLRGEILMSIGSFPEYLSQAI